jgi:hypothetical protein
MSREHPVLPPIQPLLFATALHKLVLPPYLANPIVELPETLPELAPNSQAAAAALLDLAQSLPRAHRKRQRRGPCTRCGVAKSPQWRCDRFGASLCNACGLRQKRK